MDSGMHIHQISSSRGLCWTVLESTVGNADADTDDATSKAQGVLEALRECAESMDAKAERTLSALD